MRRDLTILIVDDHAPMRRIVKNLLLELGYARVEEAEDGQSALPMLRDGQFDLLITDWNMPHMPGTELVRQVRADPALKALPVVMISAESTEPQLQAARAAGIDAFILKPFTSVALHESIGIAMTRRNNDKP